jgi:hypothetical protein
MKFRSVIILATLTLYGSCGMKVERTDSQMELARVQNLLNARNYDEAINSLEVMRNRNPADQEVSIKLLHAYAGAAGFESLKVYGIWGEVQQALKELKENAKAEAKLTIKQGLDQLLADFERVLEPIPELSPRQKRRLDQAIALYQELGLTVENAGKYNNFKWGSLHVYRLAVSLKAIASEAKQFQLDSEKVDLKAIERALLPQLKSMGKDAFMAYRLYSNSFEKIEKLVSGVNKLIAQTIGDREFKLRINELAKSESEFYTSLLNDNLRAASVLIGKTIEIYQQEGHEDAVKEAVRANLPSEQDARDSAKNVEMLIKTLIANFSAEHSEVEAGLKNIFTDELKNEVSEAIRESMAVKNSGPLKELLSSRRPDLEVIKSYYLLAQGYIQASDIEQDLAAEVEALKAKIDLEKLKEELQQIMVLLKQDLAVVELGIRAQGYKNREQVLKRQAELERQIKWIENRLRTATEEFKESVESAPDERESMQKIIDETIEFVQS